MSKTSDEAIKVEGKEKEVVERVENLKEHVQVMYELALGEIMEYQANDIMVPLYKGKAKLVGLKMSLEDYEKRMECIAREVDNPITGATEENLEWKRNSLSSLKADIELLKAKIVRQEATITETEKEVDRRLKVVANLDHDPMVFYGSSYQRRSVLVRIAMQHNAEGFMEPNEVNAALIKLRRDDCDPCSSGCIDSCDCDD